MTVKHGLVSSRLKKKKEQNKETGKSIYKNNNLKKLLCSRFLNTKISGFMFLPGEARAALPEPRQSPKAFPVCLCLWLIGGDEVEESVMSCGCSRPVPVCFCDRTSTRRASGVRAASESHTASAALGASAGRSLKPGGLSASPNGSGSPGKICGECSPSRTGAPSESGVQSEPSIPLNCCPTGDLCWRSDRLASCVCCRYDICKM